MRTRHSRKRWLLVVPVFAVAGMIFTLVVVVFGVQRITAALPSPTTPLTGGTDFTITSTITAGNPTCSSPTTVTAAFYPGVTRCITYKVTNHLPSPITVTEITIAIDTMATPTANAGCDPATNLDLSGAGFGPPLPGFVVAPSPAFAYSPSLPITMKDAGDQHSCIGSVFNFSYRGAASYTQQVIGACVGETFGATVISVPVNGNYEVRGNQTVFMDGSVGGSVQGSVQVDANGKFIATAGTITGNVTSTGGYVSLEGTKVGGNVQTSNTWLALGPGTTVGGNAQVTGGGPVCVDGTSNAPVQVGGNLQVQQLTAAHTQDTICAAAVGGNLQYQSSGAPTSPVMIGGSSSCPGNTVVGNLQVQSNSSPLTIGGSGAGNGNTITKGNIQVQTNSGGGTLINNTATGNCQLQGNVPKISGATNTAHGSNSCNASA